MPGEVDIKRLIVLMAKQPEAGRTKTRLSPPLAPAEAADLYRCFLLDKLAQIRQVPDVQMAIAYSPVDAISYFSQLASDFLLIEQVGKNLSQRLCNMFRSMFEAGYEQVMAVDGDTPTLPPDYFVQGFQGLQNPENDVVIGPTEDGGYYLIGMKQLHPTLFDVTMSTPQVTRDTLNRANEAQLNVHLLPEWYDVDWPEDLGRLRRELKDTHTETAKFLKKLPEGSR